MIGVEMDGGKVVAALPGLAARLDAANFEAVAAAILTTDLVPKTAFAEIKSGRKSHISPA